MDEAAVEADVDAVVDAVVDVGRPVGDALLRVVDGENAAVEMELAADLAISGDGHDGHGTLVAGAVDGRAGRGG